MPTVQSPAEFKTDFLSRAVSAKHRVFIQAMVILSGRVMREFEAVLAPLPSLGVDVRVQFDWITARHFQERIVFWPAFSFHRLPGFGELRRDTRKMFSRFLDAGITVTMINHPGLLEQVFPIIGRNHIKIYLVDDCVWLGGLNLYDAAFECVDVMVRYDDPRIADTLADQFRRVNDAARTENTRIPLNLTDTLFIDAGIAGNSIIYEEAVSMVKNATHDVRYISQMVPEGKLLKTLLSRAREGVSVDVITSQRSDALFTRWPFRIPYDRFCTAVSGEPNIQLRHQSNRVHAKVLIVDNSSVLFGSHNLVDTGVMLGTAEIAVRSSESDLVRQIAAWSDENSL
ncbi:MAG: phospholipase D-like domain-containing protein [Patescibacteria group bacterium]|nr:phospholipase D-like domain-containing protein [Patescibacteria group bacterium]